MIIRSIEIIKNQGIRKLIEAIQRFFWWHPIFDEVRWYANRLLRPQNQIVEVILGHKMQINISLSGIHKYLYLLGHHEPESARIFSRMIPDNATVVDIGANIGYYALIEAKKAKKVYAIEPEPGNIELLRKNIALNSYKDIVEVYQFAISDRTGKASLVISDVPNHHRLQASSDKKFKKVIEVETITLDEFLQDKEVDIVRMDVEGAEWLVINGMQNLLSKDKPLVMFIEIHSKLINNYGGNAQNLLDILFEAGFKVSHLAVVAFEPTTFSFKNCIKADITRMRTFEFNLPADKHELQMHLDQFLGEYYDYHIFLIRS